MSEDTNVGIGMCYDTPEEKRIEQLEQQLAAKDAVILQMHKDYGHELQDPNGTIWQECARLQGLVERMRCCGNCVSKNPDCDNCDKYSKWEGGK